MANVNILVEMKNSVSMFTFYPFSSNVSCHDTKAVKINQFNNGHWMNSRMFEPKLNNFYKCKLKAACYSYGPSAQKTYLPNGTAVLSGSDVDILNEIAKLLNAELEIFNFERTRVMGSGKNL